jgi:hypothetical protein
MRNVAKVAFIETPECYRERKGVVTTGKKRVRFELAGKFCRAWGTSNIERRTTNIELFLPLYPDDLLSPALSSFGGGEGDEGGAIEYFAILRIEPK